MYSADFVYSADADFVSSADADFVIKIQDFKDILRDQSFCIAFF